MQVETYDRLGGQVALVTGATRGIGKAIADALVDRGAAVYAGARDPGDVDQRDRRAIPLDVTREPDVRIAIDRILNEAGRLDVVVNNAGVRGPRERLDRVPVEEFERVLQVNLVGPATVTKHALPLLLDRDGGRVVNVSSGMGALHDMGSGSPAYRVSKAGLNALTRYLDAEYGDRGLLANSVSPGWVRTDMGGDNAPRSPSEGADTPVWLARFRPESPSGLFWRDRRVIEW